MTQPIRGKVASVLNTREIAINIGTAGGVATGMYFDVMDAQGEEIRDPDTNEVLGSLERRKVRVKIIHAQEKLALATTYRKKRVNIGGFNENLVRLGPYARSLMPPEWIEKYETLQKTEKTADSLDENGSYVNIGDPVVQVIKETE